MALIIVHPGGCCEGVVREDGNELTHNKVHRYLCPNEAEIVLEFAEAGFSKVLCAKCAREVEGRFAARTKIVQRSVEMIGSLTIRRL